MTNNNVETETEDWAVTSNLPYHLPTVDDEVTDFQEAPLQEDDDTEAKDSPDATDSNAAEPSVVADTLNAVAQSEAVHLKEVLVQFAADVNQRFEQHREVIEMHHADLGVIKGQIREAAVRHGIEDWNKNRPVWSKLWHWSTEPTRSLLRRTLTWLARKV